MYWNGLDQGHACSVTNTLCSAATNHLVYLDIDDLKYPALKHQRGPWDTITLSSRIFLQPCEALSDTRSDLGCTGINFSADDTTGFLTFQISINDVRLPYTIDRANLGTVAPAWSSPSRASRAAPQLRRLPRGAGVEIVCSSGATEFPAHSDTTVFSLKAAPQQLRVFQGRHREWVGRRGIGAGARSLKEQQRDGSRRLGESLDLGEHRGESRLVREGRRRVGDDRLKEHDAQRLLVGDWITWNGMRRRGTHRNTLATTKDKWGHHTEEHVRQRRGWEDTNSQIHSSCAEKATTRRRLGRGRRRGSGLADPEASGRAPALKEGGDGRKQGRISDHGIAMALAINITYRRAVPRPEVEASMALMLEEACLNCGATDAPDSETARDTNSISGPVDAASASAASAPA
ncbi:hypothetical protein C8J57DRAFT_1223716 [Mycena rebaudengoi]|nr:hypothetical protein C8J57DRAFT_1223716 [Mycena rebaudengoi]